MVFVGNILWFALCGIWLGLSWWIVGLICFATIIGIPFGIAAFRIGFFSFCPFGKKLAPRADAGVGTAVLNIIWIVFAGFWLALESIILGLAFCITIIGIPFGIACFNIAQASFAPLGKEIVEK